MKKNKNTITETKKKTTTSKTRIRKKTVSKASTDKARLKELRKKAEEQLKKQTDRLDKLSKQEVKKLIHELGTYQIELEMQNEELRMAYSALEESRTRYADLYDLAPVGYFTFDKNGIILEANLTGANMLGVEKQHIINKPLSLFIHQDDQDIFYLHQKRVYESGNLESCDLRVKRKDGVSLWVRFQSIAVENVKYRTIQCRTSANDITEQKKAEEALKITNELLQRELSEIKSIYNSAPVGLCVLNTGFKFVRINNRLAEINGVSAEEHIGHSPQEVVPQIADAVEAIFKKVIETGEPVLNQEIEGETAAQPGVTRSWLESWLPLRSVSGEIIGVSVVAEEVTERKKFHETLKQAHDKLSNILESITDGFVSFDQNWRCTYINDNAARLLKTTREELIGQSPWEKFPEAKRLKFYTEFNRAVDKNRSVVFEEYYPEPLNTWYECHCYPSADGLSVYFRDITERKETEKKLMERQNFIERIAETSPNILYVFDIIENKLVYANEQLSNILGYKLEHIQEMGQSVYQRIIHPDDLPKAYKLISQLSKAKDDVIHELLFRGKHLNGEWRWLCIKSVVFNRNEEGVTKEVLGTVEDITDRKNADERIKKSLHEKETLLQEVHHRVKNNMMVMTSLLKLQARQIRDERYRKMLNDSINRIKSMALIHDKLYQSENLSHIKFGNYLEGLLNNIFMTYGAGTGRISLKKDFENIPLSIGTAVPCGLIVNELVSNSLKHAFPANKKGELKVTLSRNDESRMIELKVSDNGVGIKEFAGLGLELVKTLVKQLGGSIELNREKGTEFRIRFSTEVSDANLIRERR